MRTQVSNVTCTAVHRRYHYDISYIIIIRLDAAVVAVVVIVMPRRFVRITHCYYIILCHCNDGRDWPRHVPPCRHPAASITPPV